MPGYIHASRGRKTTHLLVAGETNTRTTILFQSLEKQRHSVRSPERSTYGSRNSWVQGGLQAGILLVNRHLNHLENHLHPRGHNTLGSPRY